MQTENLGGRLPLLDPKELSGAQKELYDRENTKMVPWADSAGFRSKTEDGKLIGPFNPVLFSPALGGAFLDLQAAEQSHTTLSKRVREVVILSLGAVWKSAYELYAHMAVGRSVGLTEEAVRMLAEGKLPAELDEAEQIAQRYTTQLCREHHVAEDLYRAAEQAFGKQGIGRHGGSDGNLPSRLHVVEWVRSSGPRVKAARQHHPDDEHPI